MSKFCILLSFFLLPLSLFSQIEFWTIGTGKTIPEHQFEMSFFRPARFGITKTLEVSAHPIAFFMLPHAQVKKNWYDHNKFSIATVHAINYPSIALKKLRKKNKEGYLSKDAKIPSILSFRNEVIASKILKERTTCEAENYLLSLKLGVQFAIKMGKDSMNHIEKQILYPRTEIYHKRMLWNVGLDLDARFNHYINYSIDVDYLSMGGDMKDYAIEHKAIVMTKLTNTVMVCAGYKLSYTTFANKERSKFHIYPMVDISWVHKFRKRKQQGLFGH